MSSVNPVALTTKGAAEDFSSAVMSRVVFLDYLRVIAIFMVLLVHCCEVYYFGDDGGLSIQTRSDALWVTAIDSICRAAVPLFVMASAYLLFPTTLSTGTFLKRRLLRVGVPFLIWACVYNFWNNGSWGRMLFNFPEATGGHLWFVPMILGVYLFMPLLSPWAERVSQRELLGWLGMWLFTTTFPFLRQLWSGLYGAPAYGVTPFLYGECAWNSFGTFHYVSGFLGYALLGFWFRRFATELSLRRTLVVALPLLIVGWVIVWSDFFFRIPTAAGWPARGTYAQIVDLETSWMFCSTGVALTTVSWFLLFRRLTGNGIFYRMLIRPLSEASFGTYLVHILILVPLMGYWRPQYPTPFVLFFGAAAIFALSSLFSIVVRKIPRVGRFICG